jgi:hypothetical protein
MDNRFESGQGHAKGGETMRKVITALAVAGGLAVSLLLLPHDGVQPTALPACHVVGRSCI